MVTLVTPVEFIEEGREQVYDKEKYREMLLEAIWKLYFGFDRTLFGVTSTKNRKWWHEVREQRQKAIKYLILLCPVLENVKVRSKYQWQVSVAARTSLQTPPSPCDR